MKGTLRRGGIRKMDYGVDKRIFYKNWRGTGLLTCPFHRIEIGIYYWIVWYRRTDPPGYPKETVAD